MRGEDEEGKGEEIQGGIDTKGFQAVISRAYSNSSLYLWSGIP